MKQNICELDTMIFFREALEAHEFMLLPVMASAVVECRTADKELKTLNEDGEIGLARLFSIWANMMCAPGAATIVGCRPITMLSEILAQVHAYAREHGELEQYRASNNVNLQCKESIEAAVREHFDGMYLSHDAAKGVIETYGMERVALVLANTVQLQDWDGRYSRRNKEWAKTIPNENPETVRCGYVLNSHPAVLDGFIDLVREEQQRSRTQGEKLQPSRPSVRDKLKQELPAHKPAAPKKREPER